MPPPAPRPPPTVFPLVRVSLLTRARRQADKQPRTNYRYVVDVLSTSTCMYSSVDLSAHFTCTLLDLFRSPKVPKLEQTLRKSPKISSTWQMTGNFASEFACEPERTEPQLVQPPAPYFACGAKALADQHPAVELWFLLLTWCSLHPQQTPDQPCYKTEDNI